MPRARLHRCLGPTLLIALTIATVQGWSAGIELRNPGFEDGLEGWSTW